MQYIIYFLTPLVLGLIFTPIVRKIAIINGFVSYPRADRWHKKPTAILGGISIYLAFLFPAFYLYNKTPNNAVLALLIGGTILFITGLFDDKFHIAPYTKLFLQITAGCIAVFFGICIGWPANNIGAIPFTLLWIVGVTNSFNLLDNIDGLCAGTAVIASIMLFFSSLILSNNPLGVYGLILSGAALGFLPFNFNPAKIFMGDSGSMFLGYCLALISIAGAGRHITNLFTTLLVPVLILSVPIFDTLFVMIIRRLQGRKIFEGGKDHTSHHLVTLGLSQKRTVLLLYTISIAFGIIAILYSKMDIFIISIVAFLAIAILFFFGFFLSDNAFSGGAIKNRQRLQNLNGDKTVLNSLFMHKRRVVEVLLDFGLICVAYYSAYFLRFEGALLHININLIKESLVWIILIKMSAFFIFGLYRGVWRYISISDLLTIFKVVSIGSVASILFLTFVFRFRDYSRAVFFIDWVLLLFLITATRVSFRVLGEFFSRIPKKGKKVLIFGAGDMGEAVIREIKRNRLLNYTPIGFIDDDPSKIGNKIQGIPVLGSRHMIKNLVLSKDIEEVIIAIPSLDASNFSAIARLCQDCRVAYRRVKGILDQGEALDEINKK